MNHHGELVLLGDIIDFTLLAGNEALAQNIDSAKILAKVRKAYPDVFKAFREFIRAGNSLFYVWGNHDYLMRFKKHAHEFQKAVLKRFWDSSRLWHIWFSDYYVSPSHSLYAEHGHRYDMTNVHINGDHIILGNLMTSKFMRKGWGVKFNTIRKMARDMGINTHRMKKVDIIRNIQRTEGNFECFATQRVDYCQEDGCLWRQDCISSYNNGKS
jgi:hypothetical protein